MNKYTELKSIEPELFECFFAFNQTQFEEGLDKTGIRGKAICRAPGGLYGTREGIKKLYADYDAISKRIGEECDPQQVYNYEFDNHECGYTHDDTEAIKLVVSYFGDEKAKTVKRHNGCACVKIEDLDFS
ncbi:MAG: hypothetical protein WC389_15995 [Lutibacter sp.]|jgi:hypothetical protein